MSSDTLVNINPMWSDEEAISSPSSTSWTDDIEAPAVVAVIGVGFVGEHLVDVFSPHCKVIGYDKSPARVMDLQGQKTDFFAQQKFDVKFTSDEDDLREANCFLIAVPTLLQIDQSINISHLLSAVSLVERWVRPGSTVVIESSVAVGMTRDILGPLVRCHRVYAGMSPEVCLRFSQPTSCVTLPTIINPGILLMSQLAHSSE
jgi:UDP-N-acetyl-D-mannosaminuronate dehydrogenase